MPLTEHDTSPTSRFHGVVGGTTVGKKKPTYHQNSLHIQASVAASVRRAGFTNSGNTCYLNAVLQIMFHCIAWLRCIQRHEAVIGKCGHACIRCLLHELECTSRHVRNSANTRLMRACVESKGLIWNKQNDAADVLRSILMDVEEIHTDDALEWQSACACEQTIIRSAMATCECNAFVNHATESSNFLSHKFRFLMVMPAL